MFDRKTSLVSIINIFILIICSIIIFIFSLVSDHIGMDLNRDSITTLNEGWKISSNGIVKEDSSLPQNYDFKPNKSYSIERTINKEDFIYTTLRIRSSMMNVDAYIDNQLIYTFDVNSKSFSLNNPYPASWQLIEIPVNESLGKTLKITFSSPTSQFSGLINSIVIGNGEAIILDLIQQNYLNIIISILIIVLSLFSLSTLIWTKKLGIAKHILYLASFGIAAGLWIISESTILQILTSNRFIISTTSYISNLSIPLIITLFIRDIVLKGFKKTLSFVATLNILLLALELILQFSAKVSFIASTIYSIGMILLSSFTIIFCLIYEGYKKDNQKAKQYLIMIFALFIFASIIIGLFIIGVYQNLGEYLAIGVLGFFLLVMIDVIQSIYNLMETKNKSLIYKQLAYEDYLTKGYNRTAFEIDVEKLINHNKVFRLVLLDLNHLKKINDSYGHQEGDYAIISCYNALNKSVSKNGKCYRISGDEFACIIYDTRSDLFIQIKEQINKYLKNNSEEKPYDIVLALGTKIYDNDDNFTDFYKDVDTEMYRHKKLLKIQETRNFQYN